MNLRELSVLPPPTTEGIDEHLFKAAVQQAKESVVITTGQLDFPGPTIVYVNEAFSVMTGYAPEEVIGKTPRILQGPKTERAVLDRLKEELSAGETFHGETVNYRKDGSEFILEWEIAPVRTAEGELTHFIAVQRDITERRQHEAALLKMTRERAARQQEELRREKEARILERITDAFVSLDRDWRYTYVNQRAAEILGRRAEDLIGKHIWTEFPEGIGQKFHRAYEQSMSLQRPMQIEEFYPPFNKWFENRIYPSPEGISIFFQDVTERKQAEESLRTSEAFNRSIIRSSQDCLKVLDLDGRLLSMNESGQRLLEIQDISAYIGKSWVDVWKCEDEDAAQRALAEARAGRTGRFQGACPTMSGHHRHWDVIFSPILDVHGKPVQVLSVSRDITEIKDAQEQQKRMTDQMRASAEMLDLAQVFVRDMESKIIVWNNGATDLYGYSRQEALGKVSYELLRTEFPMPLRAIEAEVKDKGQWQGELTHAKRDGSRIVVTSRWVLHRDAGGRPVGILEGNNDITALKEAEEKIQKLNEDLEGRVRQRTEELEAANHELESFSYSVSHDLRAPLRHVSGYASLLKARAARKLDSDEQQFLSTIQGTARQMGELIDHLLDFSRMFRAGVNKTYFPIRELFDEAIQMLREQAKDRNIEWRVDDLPMVYADSHLLRQVAMNLLTNAVKYTAPREHALVEIGSSETATEQVIFVRDNGVGFDMSRADKLFGVFQRLHTQAAFEGSGIGLATVRRIVHRHDGRVWAEGQVGRGATFYFALPKTNDVPGGKPAA